VGSYAYAVTDSVAGRVVDPQGASVAGAKVVLTNAGGVKIAETVSDAAGAFRFAGVESGVYRLSAESDAFVRVEAGVALTAGRQQDVSRSNFSRSSLHSSR
jgi:hypothetical protein